MKKTREGGPSTHCTEKTKNNVVTWPEGVPIAITFSSFDWLPFVHSALPHDATYSSFLFVCVSSMDACLPTVCASQDLALSITE